MSSISEGVSFGKERIFKIETVKAKTANLTSVRKILRDSKLIWKLPTGTYGQTPEGWLIAEDYNSYQDYYDLYTYMGPVGRTVDLKNKLIWQAGFETQADSPTEKKKADDLMSLLQVDTKLRSETLNALICGNGYLQLIKETEPELRPLDPLSMSAKLDPENATKVLKYRQSGWGIKSTDLDPEDIIPINFFHLRNSIFGTGNLRRVLITAKAILYMRSKIPEIVRKRSDNPLHVKIGSPDHPVSKEVWDRIVTSFKQATPGEDLFDDGWAEIKEVYGSSSSARLVGIVELIKIFERDLISGLGIPEEALGFGQSTTQATAWWQDKQLQNEIADNQRVIKRIIEKRILEKFDLPNVRIEFNPIAKEDMNALSTRYQAEIRAGIIGPIFARKQLGYDEAEAGEGAIDLNVGPLSFSQEPPQLHEARGKHRTKLHSFEQQYAEKLKSLIVKFKSSELSEDETIKQAEKESTYYFAHIAQTAVDWVSQRLGKKVDEPPPEIAIRIMRSREKAMEDFKKILKDAKDGLGK